VRVLTRQQAIKAVKRQRQAREIKPQQVVHKIIVAAANDYVAEHPELVAEAKETARSFAGRPKASSDRVGEAPRIIMTADQRHLPCDAFDPAVDWTDHQHMAAADSLIPRYRSDRHLSPDVSRQT